jgi:tetratricopeptide (TPR) repeat protein
MIMQDMMENKNGLVALCNIVRTLLSERDYQKCEPLIFEAMKKYPHAPEPHNLIGLLLELQGDHLTAMKHFRAAGALDPTYVPARHNLDHFGTLFSRGTWAIDESDCPPEPKTDNFKLVYDKNGIGHVVRREQE